ncbi:MAG: hypothetical protein BWY65_02427 [Firmicutes bacterium ADurb.Bin373]|nr:MAG: hypothetical protein BWY65_02427 [Firmicutes bacterium ADurb.Bin373]
MTGSSSFCTSKFMDMTLIPVELSDGSKPNMVSSACFAMPPLIPNILGKLGPVISASSAPTSKPFFLKPAASSDVTEDFPTPPFPLITAITFLTLLNSFTGSFSGA